MSFFYLDDDLAQDPDDREDFPGDEHD